MSHPVSNFLDSTSPRAISVSFSLNLYLLPQPCVFFCPRLSHLQLSEYLSSNVFKFLCLFLSRVFRQCCRPAFTLSFLQLSLNLSFPLLRLSLHLCLLVLVCLFLCPLRTLRFSELCCSFFLLFPFSACGHHFSLFVPTPVRASQSLCLSLFQLFLLSVSP